MSELDLPLAPATESDGLLTLEARILGVDAAAGLVQVSVRDSALWLPAVAGRYVVTEGSSRCRVLLDPQRGRPEMVLGPVTPRAAQVPATMSASTSTTATVTLDGATYELPYLTGSYGTLPAAVWVSLDDWGSPTLVLGPSAVADTSQTPLPPAGGGGATVQATVSIPAQWSGSWRVTRSAWDRWNTGNYGGRSTLYQGDGYGSGPMVGLATYGDQLVNLGALSIDRVQVAVRPVGLASGSPPVTLQGSPHGSQPGGAPASSGDTATGMGGLVDLPASVLEAMRTGAVKGLATVGGAYSAAAGAGNGDGMALTVTYTRPA